MSPFEALAAAASSDVMRHMAERDEWGVYIPVLYFPPDSPLPGIPWSAIVSELEVEDAEDVGTGTHQEGEQIERVTLDGQNPTVPFLQLGSFEVSKYPGELFSIDSIISGGPMTTVEIFRHKTEKIQRRGVERGG